MLRPGKKRSHRNPTWRAKWDVGDGSHTTENVGEFDELVIGEWFHIEKMDNDKWWIRIGDARIDVRVRGGERVDVWVERGEYGDETPKPKNDGE